MRIGEVLSSGVEKMLDTRTLFSNAMQRLLKWMKLIFKRNDDMSYRMEEEFRADRDAYVTKTASVSATTLIEDNAKMCAVMEDRLAQLELALELVLRSEPPSEKLSTATVSRGSTPLENRLDGRNENLQFLINRLQTIISRISL